MALGIKYDSRNIEFYFLVKDKAIAKTQQTNNFYYNQTVGKSK